MKKLTKEDLPIGTKVVPHDKTIGKPFKNWLEFNNNKEYVKVTRHDIKGYLVCDFDHFNYSDITLYEPTQKIKKSELQKRIELLEKKVADLEGKGIVEVEAEPQYQAGTLGAFWDGDWDNAIDETSILTARLDKIVLGAYKPINRATCFQNFKPLKFD